MMAITATVARIANIPITINNSNKVKPRLDADLPRRVAEGDSFGVTIKSSRRVKELSRFKRDRLTLSLSLNFGFKIFFIDVYMR